MKISGFTFLKNAESLGFPFIESIKSILPLVDELIIALGPCDDNTFALISALNDKKIRIIHTTWNDKMRTRGYVYAQQKMIAQFNCSGDWAFYLEGDEIVHESDLPKIKASMEQHLHNPQVEALIFDFIHFYGNTNTYIDSPGWYRREARVIKNNIRSYAVDGQFWYVLEKNRTARYPKVKHTQAKIYHYGWARAESEMNSKLAQVEKYWNKKNPTINYKNFDGKILKKFGGTHPIVMQNWLSPINEGIFQTDPNYQLTSKQKKHRFFLLIEKLFNVDFAKKHFKLI